MSAADPMKAPSVSSLEPAWVSILINNWNYASYLSEAIDSALAQTHPDTEVVVVDDGSTDGSVDVLDAFADRVTVIRQENLGQPAAAAAGLAASHGQIIMFLDADDFLDSTAAARVVAAWQDGCAKVQFRLALIDRAGLRVGADPPASVELPSGDVVPTIARFGWYHAPVTSGSAYPRDLLERLFPIPEDFHNIDGYLNTVTPFYGAVVSIQDELGAYRQHGENRWAFSERVDLDRIQRRIMHELIKERYLEQTAQATGRFIPPHSSLRSGGHVLYRLASRRLAAASHPVPTDTVGGLVRAGVLALVRDPSRAWPDKMLDATLLLTIALAPKPLAARGAEFAFLSRPRPQWMRRLGRALRRLSR